MSGPTIPGYRFIRLLGSGRFADVYLYEQDGTNQKVAIKVVRPDVPLTEREKATFIAEADAMARLLDHPSIVSVITAGTTTAEEGSRPYLVMRYCPPPDLGARVQAQPMSVADSVSTGIKLAGAVETAHRSGIIHRDIKPSHVLVTPDHEPALTDFGLAGWLHEVEGDHEVRISHPWSPPELLDGRSDGSVASDVYSLGATIWHLLVGRSPFSVPNGDNSSRALSARILHSAPPRINRPDVPAVLDQLLVRCLAKTTEHRPSSALELARALQRVETEAGPTRTPIAVEGERPDLPSASTVADGDQTRPEPVGVVPGSAPREVATPSAGPSVEPVAGTSSRAPVPPAAWWALGAVALLAVVVVFGSRLGGSHDFAPPAVPQPSASSGAPGVVHRPVVTARRAGPAVTFRWRPSDTPLAGDTYQWRIPRRGGTHLTNGQTVTLTSADRLCLQVRLTRADLPPSTWASACG